MRCIPFPPAHHCASVHSDRSLRLGRAVKVFIPYGSNLGHPCSAIQPPLLAPRSGVAPKYSSCFSMAYFVPLSTSQGRDARNFGMPPSISGLFSHSSTLVLFFTMHDVLSLLSSPSP